MIFRSNRFEGCCRHCGALIINAELIESRLSLCGSPSTVMTASNDANSTSSDTDQARGLELLVENALDFLDRSIQDLSTSTKYSVIHFYSSIELFLKARLLAEHWTLVVDRRRTPNRSDFEKGAFASISLEEAVALLEQVVGVTVPTKHLEAFKRVRNVRNQMVHFYHVDSVDNDGTKRMRGIVSNQLEAWYLLNTLLHRWGDVFSRWKERIGALDSQLRKHGEYLKAAYDELRVGIKIEADSGVLFVDCPACEFEAECHPASLEVVYTSDCRVCRFADVCIRISCPRCGDGEVVFRESTGSVACAKCNAEFERDALLEHFVDSGEAYSAARDGGHYAFPVNCGCCERFDSVVELPGGELLCSACFDRARGYARCEWCDDESTRLPEFTLMTGCAFCDGRGIDDD